MDEREPGAAVLTAAPVHDRGLSVVPGGGAVCSDAGIDTVRFRFRGLDGAGERLIAQPDGAREGAGGALWRSDGVGRVEAWPSGLVCVEGRAAALIEGRSDCHDLLAVGDLPLAEQAARAQLAANGLDADVEHAALGRIDLAAELRFSRGDEGTAFLHALRALDVPWGKLGSEGGKRGAIETVYVRGMSGRSVHARAYDKGVESGSDGPGRRIRYERQVRPRRTREQTVAMFQASDVRREFLGRLLRYLDVPSVAIADNVGAVEALGDLYAAGEITPRQRDRLTAYLVWRGEGFGRAWSYKLTAELRSVGIALDPTAPKRLTVPVGRHLQALAAAWPQAA